MTTNSRPEADLARTTAEDEPGLEGYEEKILTKRPVSCDTGLAASAALRCWESQTQAAGATAPGTLLADARRGDASAKLPDELRALVESKTVVASAGNFGRNDTVMGQDAADKPLYQTIYGGIGSPGNSPEVIIVGATKNPNQSMETWNGTWKSVPTPAVNTAASPNPLRRTDLQVASYSSRGPTLVDGLVKPDARGRLGRM